MKQIVLFWLRVYQLTLSYFWGRQCRFEPTCSAYAVEAVQRHGVVKGSGMAVRRVCRCGPALLGTGHPGGYDPVP